MAVSYITDDGADVAYAEALVGKGAWPTGRLRVVQETNQLQLQWEGPSGIVWLAVMAVSEKNKPTIIRAPGHG
jgi:hypothetical protein